MSRASLPACESPHFGIADCVDWARAAGFDPGNSPTLVERLNVSDRTVIRTTRRGAGA